ncbi:MAG: hypothetical protein AB1814_16450 [Thermodesulfobacteriota bacterium]
MWKHFNILLVRKDGPVQPLQLGSWAIYLLLALLVLALVSIGVGGYLFYRQHLILDKLLKDTRRLSLSMQVLERMLSEQDGWPRPRMAPPVVSRPAPAPALRPADKPAAAPAVKPADKPAPPRTAAAPSQPAPPSQHAAASPPPPPAAKDRAQPAGHRPATPTRRAGGQELVPEPDSVSWVEIRNVQQSRSGNSLVVRFEVANKQEPGDQAEGYIFIILRGQRRGVPWLEAWPPTRLTPLGRPENYKRGAPFSVRRYRALKARFAIADKHLEQLEFIIYDRQGELVLVQRMPVSSKLRKS